MPYFRAKSCHEACGARIQDYLERENRALDRDCLNIISDHQNHWAYYMDLHRVATNNDLDWYGKAAVTYQHFVISPDPKDGIGLEELRDYAKQWAQEFFGYTDMFGELVPGKFGSYQVAIVYHDDNEGGIPHAHVIVNCASATATGRLHLDEAENELLYVRAQELAAERGWSCFEDESQKQNAGAFSHTVSQKRYLSKEERSFRKSGMYSWKQDLAEHIYLAKRSCTTEAQFVSMLKDIGIGVRLSASGDDYVFSHHANPNLWATTGYRLGKTFSKEAIETIIAENRARQFYPDRWQAKGATLVADADRTSVKGELALSRMQGRPRDASVRSNIVNAVVADLPNPRGLTYKQLVAHAKCVYDLSSALAVRDREWVRCTADFTRVYEMLRLRLEKLGNAPEFEDLRIEYEQRLANLQAAESICATHGVYVGVADTPCWQGPPKGHAGAAFARADDPDITYVSDASGPSIDTPAPSISRSHTR